MRNSSHSIWITLQSYIRTHEIQISEMYYKPECQNVILQQVVSLTIRALSLEEDINCAFDYLKLTDLFIQTSATLCGVLRPNDVCRLVSVGGSVRITFHSDDSITAGGFVVSYIAIQPGSDVTNCALMGQHDDGGTAVTWVWIPLVCRGLFLWCV